MKLVIAFLAIVLVLSSASSRAGFAVHVIDGDTLDVDGFRHRLHGIDAPEAGQACSGSDGLDWSCGRAAIEKIEELVSGKHVTCDSRGSDGYGRLISVCVADGREINATMVEVGLAWAFRKYTADYVPLEDAARSRGIGIWQAPTQTAWDYREAHWQAAVQSVPDGSCPIKGNISRKNVKIYHVPWSKDYPKTRIDPSRGERWFCSEADAVAAGWRAPAWGR
ncbi:succinoglycan biosynthesis protein [Sinorhizobium fredii USDA 205]|uniref:Thermonuclease family protein n=1 Tax=Rhizobium fredii TaxID=380 RepID=A0A844AFP6_RHIFR|nr:thermonuclease family protein [Sinorhizobium fredii]KSV87332.1 succinoglycan biosynthesis protein [Sinorhizobium fredii USDA 205]MQX11793.1 thermonuclease family protein [Sinorhizobium fredii]GEC31695.1 succinoglycan biosynthesis protein [Sinorhizobium fredii]GLS09018.1 succinoglycan biosynthesis protein [Sinorhizobium fredii]